MNTMNLQPVPIENIPVGRPLPWRLYDRNGYIVFARGELVASVEQLKSLHAGGLLQDTDAPLQTRETGDFSEFRETAPLGTFPPQGIKPQIGEIVQIRLPKQNPQFYYSVHLIGYIKNKSILITRPGNNPFIPVEGELAEVRMVTGSHIYAFEAAIQRLCISPVQYVHLDYPLEVRVQKLRKSPWARVNLAATVTDSEGARELARLVNLSPDGGQLHAAPTLGKIGDKLQLSLHVTLNELKATLNLNAIILHVRQPDASQTIESNLLEYGLSFNEVATADALWLNALVYRHIAEGDIA
jgi:hypothetical protein